MPTLAELRAQDALREAERIRKVAAEHQKNVPVGAVVARSQAQAADKAREAEKAAAVVAAHKAVTPVSRAEVVAQDKAADIKREEKWRADIASGKIAYQPKGGKKMGLSKTFKKITSTAVSTAAGFAGGGNVGFVAGLTKGVIDNSKTSKAKTVNLRTAGQSFVTGAVANVVAGAALKGAAAIAAKGGTAVVAKGGVAKAGGGLLPSLKGAMTKAVAFGKSGGAVGNVGKLFTGVAGLAPKALPLLSGLFKKGIVPGTSETPQSVVAGQDGLGEQIEESFDDLKENYPDGGTPSDSFRNKALGFAKNAAGDWAEKLRGKATGEVSAADPMMAEAPSPNNMGGEQKPNLLLAGAGALAIFFLLKRK